MRDGLSAFLGLPSLLVTALFTTGSGYVITPGPTPPRTPYIAAYRTKSGAYHPQQTLFYRPRKRDRELEAREVVTWDIETCGWTSKNAYLPKTCPVGLQCGYILGGDIASEYGLVCYPLDDANEPNWADAVLPTTCYSYGQANITAASAYSQTFSSTLLCGTSAQQCATAIIEGAPILEGYSTSFELKIFTSMFCTTSSTKVTIYHTTTNTLFSSEPPGSSGSQTSSSSSSSSSSGSSSSSSSSSSPSTSTSVNPGKLQNQAKTTTSPTPTTVNNPSSPSTGTIAGATAGAVVGVALIGAVAGYYIWRRADKKKHTPREISRDFSTTVMGQYPRYQPLHHRDTSYPPMHQAAYAPINHLGYSPRSELAQPAARLQSSPEMQERLWSG